MPLYCPQGHENPVGSRFCSNCGEKLEPQVSQGIYPGLILSDRYCIIRQLAVGGFGRTYLAENLHRFHERCVLKEFAPQVRELSEIEKAKELFQREAGALHHLNHPQLPRFLEFFEAELQDGVKCLFLAQDYIEGDNYYDLLHTQGRFCEADVRQLITNILPVLDYIHSRGVIHRDISPDNIVLRRSDNLPVLIDFGGVKQVAAKAVSTFTQTGYVPTLLGKQGYAPEEQMRQGQVFPSSDLYALAVTALVLLTAKEPQELYDSYKGTWRWRREIKVSPHLETILQKMLAYKPEARFATATEVMHALQSQVAATPAINISRILTVNVVGRKPDPAPAHQYSGNSGTQVIAPPALKPQPSNPLITLPNYPQLRPLLVKAAYISVAGLIAWVLVSKDVLKITPPLRSPVTVSTTARLQKLTTRRQALAINATFFTRLVDDAFHTKHPELNGRSLKANSTDSALRSEWFSTAEQLLDKLEQAQLTTDTRRRLGSYTQQIYETWLQQANQGKLGDYTIEELTAQTNRKFEQLFPQQRAKKLNLRTFGQIWYAIAADKVKKSRVSGRG